MKPLFALSLLTTLSLSFPLQAKTILYSGTVKLDDGQSFLVESSIEANEQYRSTSQSLSKQEVIDYDVHIWDPFECTLDLRFKGPKFTFEVKNKATGESLLKLNETIDYVASATYASATDYECPKPQVFAGYKGHMMLQASGARMFKIGTYGKSPLWIGVPSVMSYEAHGNIIAHRAGGFVLDGAKITTDYDSKVGFVWYRPVPEFNREETLTEFKITKNQAL